MDNNKDTRPMISIVLDTVLDESKKAITDDSREFINALAGQYRINIMSYLHQQLIASILDKFGVNYTNITTLSKEVSDSMFLSDRTVCYRGDYAQTIREIVHFRKHDEPMNGPGIEVTYRHHPKNGFTALKITGHANLYPGRDPLCGGISALGYTLVGTLSNIAGLDFIKKEFTDCIDVRIVPLQDEGKRTAVNIVFETILIGIRQLALGYPNHITVQKI